MSKLAKAVIDFITKRVDRVAVKLPAVVTLLNSDNTVNLKILTKEFDKQTGLYVEQQLFDVAVDFPASYEDAYLRLPVKIGTTGTITIFDNDISGLMNGGNETPVDVDTPRRHNLADCKFKPDFQTQKKTITIDANAEFRNKDMSILLYPDGRIKIKGATQEMVAVISSMFDHSSKAIDAISTLIDTVASTAIPDPGGAPSGIKGILGVLYPPLKTAIDTQKTNIDTDKTNLDTLKVT